MRSGATPTRWQLEPAQLCRTSLPATYIIDYATNHLLDRGFISRVAQAAPQLLHLGHDVPFTGHWGPRAVPLPVKEESQYRQLTPDETRARFRGLKDMVRELHRAGADLIFPYIDSQQMGGDLEKRLGFWEFYDSWEKYRSFGLPRRPADDPAEWLQHDPGGHIHFNNPAAYPSYEPQFFYAPCPNNRHWRKWLEFVVRYIADVGFDGVFVDDNIIHCYCRDCREGFSRYLRSRYRPDELRAAFGAGEVHLCSEADKTWWAKQRPEFLEFLASRYKPGELETRFKISDYTTRSNLDRIGYGFLDGRARDFIAFLHAKYPAEERRKRFGAADLRLLGIEKPQDRLRWYETQRFWAWSIADLLLQLKRAIAPQNPDLVFFPNWGSMQTVGAVDGRRLHGKNVAEWKRGADSMMFEEDYEKGMPGRADSGGFTAHGAQYKFSLSNGVRPVVLFAGAHGEANIDLAHAEAAAGGGGSFVQSGYEFPEVRRRFRKLYERRPDLFAGYEPVAPVALAYFYNQAHFENREHLREVYRLHPALAEKHVLFDFLTEDTLDRLRQYRVVILPSVLYLSRSQERAIEKWVAAGGRLLVPGERPAFYEDATPRAAAAFAQASADLAPAYDAGWRWTRRDNLPGLRANVYWKKDRGRAAVVTHLLNYDVPAGGEPRPARAVPVSFPLPETLERARLGKLFQISPDSDQAIPLEGDLRDGKLSFEVPEVRLYRVVEALLDAH
ncbi:MAG: hypothetical protein ACKV22_33755 [Bryobacteraceae bacterium]